MVPGIELVESTRYFRLDGDYAASGSSALKVGGWWPFLICTLFTYSLIPRFIFMIISKTVLSHLQKKAVYLSAEFDSLHRRLISPLLSTRSDENPSGKAKSEHAQITTAEDNSLKESSAHLIIWGEMDQPERELIAIIKSSLKVNIIDTHFAGMLENSQDQSTLKEFEENRDNNQIILLAESWEAPGRAVEHFLNRLRSVIGRDRKIIIALININPQNIIIGPSKTDWQNWQDLTIKMNDPFICIEPVTGET